MLQLGEATQNMLPVQDTASEARAQAHKGVAAVGSAVGGAQLGGTLALLEQATGLLQEDKRHGTFTKFTITVSRWSWGGLGMCIRVRCPSCPRP